MTRTYQTASAFDLGESEQMTPTEVTAFERRVLASGCPEVLRGAGPPTYDTAPIRMPGVAESLRAVTDGY
jgi:hypothetical protein